MHDLTQRQIEILKALIEEYIDIAGPVGSETLEKKHNLSASPATIRNEMVRLTDLGYLQKPHTSAGRVPTPVGMKFYVNQLMKEKVLSVAEEVSVKEQMWDLRDRSDRFMQQLVRVLAERTRALAVITTESGDTYCAGYANILDMPEFYDIDLTKNILLIAEEVGFFSKLFSGVSDDDVHVLLGEELGPQLQGPYGMVFRHFQTPQHLAGEVGVLGPARLNYTAIVPTVRYFGDLIEEVAHGW